MSSWSRRSDKLFVERASPAKMKLRFPTEVFVGVDGNAQSNANWIWKPDLSAVAGFLPKHWTISGDNVSLMTPAERSAVDVAEDGAALTADRDANKQRFNDEKVLTALALVMRDEINLLRAQHGLNARTVAQLRNAVLAKVDSLG